jgi:hypothetical protein
MFYTDKKGTGEKKYIILSKDHVKIERMNNNRFKLIGEQLDKKKTKKVFKCADKTECSQWVERILEAIEHQK